MAENWILLGVIGLGAGLLSGLFGIGGGVVIVPALIFVAGLHQLAAHGTSLGALLLPVGFLGALVYHNAGHVNKRYAVLVSAGLMAGTFLGARLAISLHSDALRIAFGVFLLFVGWRLTGLWAWFKEKMQRMRRTVDTRPEIGLSERLHETGHSVKKLEQLMGPRPYQYLLSSIIGICAGILSGLFGIGGGIIIVPALSKLLSLDHKTASGTSLAALLPPVGLPGILIYHKAGAFELSAALPVAMGLLVGAMGGAFLGVKLCPVKLRKAYGVLVLLIAVKLLINL